MVSKMKENINIINKNIKDYFKDIFNNKGKKITFIIYIILPFVLNLLIETLNRRSLIKCLGFLVKNPIVFLDNVLIITLTLSVVLIFKKRIFLMSVISLFWIGFGIANFVLRSFRETPFSASDLKMIDSAITIIDKYLNLVSIILIIGLIVLAIAFIVLLWLKSPKYADKLNYFRNLIYISVIAMFTAGAVNLSIATNILSFKFSNLTEAYFDYGFVYCFSNSLVNTGVKKPTNYSNDTLEKIIEKINNVNTVDETKKRTPNIIFLQLESFFNVNNVKNLKLSEDPIPNFNKLKAEYPSGYLSVNNVGYGTANTEFEVITGMNLDDFGPSEFPFKTILKSMTCESLAYNLRSSGYACHAMHNNTATFYSRNEIFSQLGFSDYTAIESMYVDEFTPLGWAKDKFLTDEILKVLDSTDEQDFIYTISVQGHGSYPSTKVLDNPKISVEGPDDERQYSFEYYVNEISEMDEFIGELVTALSERDEETILVMYGDHLPSLGLTEDEIINKNLYQTEYVIWNNFGLKFNDKDIETFQLGSRVLESINIDTGVINKFHQVYKNKPEYLTALHTLEYDILYGKQYVYGGINPYVATDIKMGINDQIIKDINVEEEDNEKYIVIEGDNFTKYCYVFINDERYNTEYIDKNHLRIKYGELKALDSFTVKLMSGDTVLKVSSEYLYVPSE